MSNSLVSVEYNYFQTNDHKSIKSRLWGSSGGGLLEYMEAWSKVMKPENLNKFAAINIDEVKKVVALSYFHHPSSALPDGIDQWFSDVILAYQNILAGNDMQETRSILTGVSSTMEDEDDRFRFEVETSEMLTKINNNDIPRSEVFQKAIQSLDFTSCMSLSICHQERIEVCQEYLLKRETVK